MMKIFNRILWGIKPPENKSDIWFDGDVFKIYRKGDWEAITIEIDAASKLADVIKNINDVYQTKLTEGDGILLEDSKISVRRMFQVVNNLPKIGEYNTIYLLVENNKEIGSYIYINNEWMSLVSTIEIDKNLNIYSTNPVENKAVTKKIESLDVVRIVEGGVNGLESGNFRDGSVGSAISSDIAFAGITLTREHVGCTIQGVKWIYNGGLILFPNFSVNTSCTINLRNNYGDKGSIKMYYRDITSLDIDIILPNEHITLMKNSNVFLPENVNTVLTNKLAYYQIVGIYNNGFDVDSFAPYFQFDLTRDIRTLYFKNGDWKKVLIEDNVKTINGHSILGDGNIVVEGGEGGSGIYEIKYDYLNENLLSGEDIAFNKEVFDKLNKNKVSALYVTINIDNTPVNIVADSFVYAPPPDGGSLSCVYLTFSSDALTNLGLQKKTVTILSNGQCAGMLISSNIVDDEMSETSENAVQNKVITKELNNKVDKVSGKQLSTEDFTTNDKQKLDGLSNYDDSEIKANLEQAGKLAYDAFMVASRNEQNKVDKIEGKGLSTEDFTTALKTKLEGMNSFDPTEINNKVNGLQTQVDTLVSGDTSTAIESFNEIINFLNGIEDTNSLEGIIAGIERQITNKQDTIADLDTIRSGAALGATALQTVPKGYATETWVSTEIAKAQLDDEGVDPSGFATKDDIKGLATKEEVNEIAEQIPTIDGLATETYVEDKIASINIPSIEGLATEEWVKEQNYLTEHQDITGKQDLINDLEAIRDGAAKGATALQRIDYPQLEDNLIDNGFYHSPDGMLHRSDMEDAVQESLNKADSALQSENDPIFSASPAASITTERMQEWDNKAGKVVNHASVDTNVELTPYVTHKWDTISSLTLTFSENTESEYNVVFEASDADFVLSIPQNIRWANSQIPQFEAKKQYEINIKGERALYAMFDAPYIEGTFLEYIENDGVDYILTDIYITKSMSGMRCKSMILTTPSSNVALAGTRNTSSGTDTAPFIMWYLTSGRYLYWDGVRISGFGSFEPNVAYTDEHSGDAISLDCSYPIAIFGVNNQGRIQSGSAFRLYYLELLDSNGNPIVNLRPFKRTHDNAIGLLDKVSGTFYPSNNGNLIGG